MNIKIYRELQVEGSTAGSATRSVWHETHRKLWGKLWARIGAWCLIKRELRHSLEKTVPI